MANFYGVRFLETSAKDSKNVEQAFILMTREIKARISLQQPLFPSAKGGANLKQYTIDVQ